MISDLQPGARHSSPVTCHLCAGSGWKSVFKDGRSSVVVCDCRRSKAGMQSVAEIVSGSPIMQKMLTPKDRDIAAIIARRRGAAQAISIEEITGELLAVAASCARRDFDGDHRSPLQESTAKAWERSIKDSVRRLRRAGMKVGACRNPRPGTRHPAPGYYVISNAKELSATVRPMLRQAIDELKTIEALTGRGFYARELEGQARLEFEGQESA